jgi:hypothetical protein
VQAIFHLKIIWMEFLFFPSMAECAFIFQMTTIVVRCNEGFCLPILTDFLLIGEKIRFPSIILPIVSIDANVSLMVVFTIRTPNSLEMEYIEVHIFGELLNKLY